MRNLVAQLSRFFGQRILSILHWRCWAEAVATLVGKHLCFQYSIGDAWREHMLNVHALFELTFQYSIGDAPMPGLPTKM